MKRRDFLKTSTAAAIALAGSQQLLQASTSGEAGQSGSTQAAGPPAARAGRVSGQGRSVSRPAPLQAGAFPPKPPVFAASRLSPEVKVSPMPLRRTAAARHCPAARLLQHDSRHDGQRGAHLRQWTHEHRGDCAIRTRSRSFSTTKAFSCRGRGPLRLPRPRTYFRKCGKWYWTGNTRKRLNSRSRK